MRIILMISPGQPLCENSQPQAQDHATVAEPPSNICSERLARPEQAPALLALADALNLVMPAAHDGVVIALAELSNKGIAGGLSLRQLLLERCLKLQQSRSVSLSSRPFQSVCLRRAANPAS